MYALVRPALFALDPERAHALTLGALSRRAAMLQRVYARRVPRAPVSIMGLNLANPIGLAAGLDKDGVCIEGLAGLGFGFLELGTVTPRAQPGNEAPRLFRLTHDRALVNRMGFNNQGTDALAQRVRAAAHDGVIGINLGRNAETPPERAVDDYRAGLRAVADVASYVTVNVSSPNTQGLRDLQHRDQLDTLLAGLVAERDRLAAERKRALPLVLKIAPDLDERGLDAVAEAVNAHGFDGVIATNTTIARDGLALRWREVAGGLSGVPLRARATAVIAALRARLDAEVPIIGVGGIQSARDAVDKLAAGASALQIYTGLIYRGPSLVRECAEAAAQWQSRRRVMAQAAVVRGDRARAEADARTARR